MSLPPIWNLGLPRTGTTSTTAALSSLNIPCKPVVAGWVGDTLARRGARGFESRKLKPPPGTLLIATWRDFRDWELSMLRWRPKADPDLLVQMFLGYTDWLRLMEQERKVGIVEVRRGWPNLLRALAVAAEGAKFPHLNRSPVEATV